MNDGYGDVKMSDDFNDDDDNVSGEIIVRYSLNVKTLRVIENEISYGNWQLKSEIIHDPEIEPDEFEIKIALMKVRYFFEEMVSNAVIWCNENEWASTAFLDEDGKATLGNFPIITPFEPTDDHLAIIFQSKMNAFAAPGMQFNFVELNPIDNDISFLFIGNAEESLPSIEDWVGERSYFDKPWWARDDASTIDVVPDEDADLNEKPSFAFSLDFIGEHLRPKDITNAKIIKPEFKPQIIKGGKEDS